MKIKIVIINNIKNSNKVSYTKKSSKETFFNANQVKIVDNENKKFTIMNLPTNFGNLKFLKSTLNKNIVKTVNIVMRKVNILVSENRKNDINMTNIFSKFSNGKITEYFSFL